MLLNTIAETQDGIYRSYIKKLCPKYPTLMRLEMAFAHQEAQKISGMGRAAIVEIAADKTNSRIEIFEDAVKFRQYLRESRASSNNVSRICVLEDIVGDYVDAFGAFGSVDPLFFADHLQLVNLAGTYRGALPCGPRMPSTCDPAKSFSLVYHEMIESPPWSSEGSSYLCNFHSRRKLTLLPEMWKGSTRPGIIGRRVSFYSLRHGESTQNLDRGGWIALILVDPPLSRYGSLPVQEDPKQPLFIAKEPERWMGGYVDWTPWRIALNHQQRPECLVSNHSRESTLSDITAHLCVSISEFEDMHQPASLHKACITLINNLAVANWMMVLELIKMHIRNLDWRIHDAMSDYHSTQNADVEYYGERELLLHAYRRYWTEYREQVFNNMVQLGISSTPQGLDSTKRRPFRGTNSRHSTSLLQSPSCQAELEIRDDKDWSYILWSLEAFISQAADLSTTMSIRVANLESYKSNQLASAAQRLTGLGVIFLPLSLSVGIFSMNDSFLPGGKFFWIVVSVAVPLAFTCVFGLLLAGRLQKMASALSKRAIKEIERLCGFI